MPRYSFKSTICTVAYILWRLTKDPDIRVLIYSDATNKAIGFLDSIKAHIEGRAGESIFRSIFGKWESDSKSGRWNRDQMTIAIRKMSRPEPSVDTGGIETSKTGFHYDIIIFDDIVSDKNITSKDLMDKTDQCYKNALSLLKPGGDIIMVGTRWHFGDLYGRILAEGSRFATFITDGVEDKKYGLYPFSDIGLDKDFLDEQLAKQGTYLFSCIYRNSPTDPETAVFKVADFGYYGSILKDDLYITATCDPAGEGEDFTGITVVGTDNNMDMHILECVNAHLQPSEIIDKIISLHYKYNFKMLGIETNFFRGMLEMALRAKIDELVKEDEKFRRFGIHEFEATSRRGQSKVNRIMALQPYHEKHSIKFPGEKFELLNGGFAELAYQMIQFPHSAHDDLMDSLAYHLPLIRKGGIAKKAELPINSPAWLEKRSWLKDVEANSHLPRRFRKTIGELAFS